MDPASNVIALRIAFENMTRNQHDIDDTYQLMSDEHTILSAEILPQEELIYDTSLTVVPGSTWQTPYALPTGVGVIKKIVLDIIPYYPVPFDKIIGYRYSGRHYAIDARNKKIYFTGAVTAPKIVNMFYTPAASPFSSATEATDLVSSFVLFDPRFWRLIPWGAAFTFLGGIDGDDVARIISQAQLNAYTRLRDAFTAYDADKKLEGLGGRLGYADEDDRKFDVGLL